MAEADPGDPFLTERRVLGLLGASLLATVAYGVVTGISLLHGVVFFVIFALVFAGLNYAVYRYD